MTLDFTRVRAVLFDLDGVLYRGSTPLQGVDELLQFLARRQVAYACITNNASRTREQYSAKLHSIGIRIPAERIVTSATATGVWLRSRAPRGTTIYAIGMDGLREALFGDDYFVEQPHEGPPAPNYVVHGADFEVTYAKLRIACLALRAGAEYIGTNGDTTFPSEAGIIPGVGAFILGLEAASGKKATIIGKPEPAMFDAALQLLGVPAQDAVVVGDRLDTDILGAHRAGIPSATVLTGVSTAAEAEQSTFRPDATFEDLPHLQASWQQSLGT